MSELQTVAMIWESFHFMFKMLKSEPEPRVSNPDISSSTDNQPLLWGYSPEQKSQYKFHAERFYQLFCVHYSYSKLTPYMMKFIDYGPYFMENLPVPINRFQTEGSEHMNYDHNCFYYNHTTRHGGKNRVEPLKALFLHMWRRMCHDIEFQSQNSDVVEGFQLYIKQNIAAFTINKHIRGWLVRRRLQRKGIISDPQNKQERMHNFAVTSQLIAGEKVHTQKHELQMFAGMTFVLTGSVPKFRNKRCSQADVSRMIKKHDGRVRKKVPGSLKGRSTKQYFILYEKS